MKKLIASIFFIFCFGFICAENYKQPTSMNKHEFIQELIDDGWEITVEKDAFQAKKANTFLFNHEITQMLFTFKNDKLEKQSIAFFFVSMQEIIEMIGNYLYVNDASIVNFVDVKDNATTIYAKTKDPEEKLTFTILQAYDYNGLSVTYYY